MDRKYEQANLLTTVGMFFLPFLESAGSKPPLTETEVIKLRAKLHNDFYAFRQEIDKFAKGESGADYSMIADAHIQPHITTLWNWFHQKPMDQAAFVQYEALREQVVRGILMIPVDVESQIFQARTPFQTYKFLKNLFNTASRRVDICDRYLDATLFYRYLDGIQPHVSTTVVTSPPPEPRQKRDMQRYAAFMDASKLFAQERSHTHYSLRVSDRFHDRWIRCDDVIYAIGGSLKQLDQHFTVSRLDGIPSNTLHFEEILDTAQEVFGPTNTIHP